MHLYLTSSVLNSLESGRRKVTEEAGKWSVPPLYIFHHTTCMLSSIGRKCVNQFVLLYNGIVYNIFHHETMLHGFLMITFANITSFSHVPA